MLGTTPSSEGARRHAGQDMLRMTCEAKKENFFSVEPCFLRKRKAFPSVRLSAFASPIPMTLSIFCRLFGCSCLTEEMCIDPDAVGGDSFYYAPGCKGHIQRHTWRSSHPVQNTDWETSNLLLGSCAGKRWFFPLEMGRIFP